MALDDSNIEFIFDMLIKSVFLRDTDLLIRFIDNVFICCKYREFYVSQYAFLLYALFQTIANAAKIQKSINLGFQTKENIDQNIFTFKYLIQNERKCKLYVNKQLNCFLNKKEKIATQRKSLFLSESQIQNGNKNELNEEEARIVSVINMNSEKNHQNENENIEDNDEDQNEVFFNNFIMKSDSILNLFRDKIFTINQCAAKQPWRLFCICKLMDIFENASYYKYIDEFYQNSLTIELGQMNVFAFFAPLIKIRNPTLYENLYNEMEKKKRYSRLPFAFNDFFMNFEEMDHNNWNGYEIIIENCGFREETPLYAIRYDDVDFFIQRKENLIKESKEEKNYDDENFSPLIDNYVDYNMRVKENIFIRYPHLRNCCTLLQLAAYYGSEKCFEFLLENGADPKLKDNIGLNVIHYAVIGGSNEIIFKLQKLGFTFDIGAIALTVESYRFTLFQWILSTRKVNFEESYLQTGTVIHRAASSNNVLFLLFVISKGVNINLFDHLQLTPLFYAASNCSIDVINLLLSHKMIDWELSDKFKDTPLHGAAKSSDCDTFLAIMSYPKSDINIKDFKGKTSLYYALADGKYDVVQMIISKYGDEVDFDVVDDQGQGLGFVAPFSGFLNTFILVCNCDKIELNRPRNDGYYIIHIIVSSNQIEFVKLFLEQERADPNVKLPDGSTPLHIAAKKGFTEIVDLFINNVNADVNARDGNGMTPLHIAIKHINIDCVKILVNCERVNQKLSVVLFFFLIFIMVFFFFFFYLVPLDFAKLLGLQDIVDIILDELN